MRIFHPLAGLLSLVLVSSPPPTEAKYYVVIFTAQADSVELQLSHTFATFVKTTEEEPDRPEVHTTTWLPENLEIVIWRRFPEAGKNLDLTTTLKWAKSVGAQVMYWGPYEIKKETYEMALKQEDNWTGGKPAQQALDRRFLPNREWIKDPRQVYPEVLQNLGVEKLGLSLRSMNSTPERRPLLFVD